MDEDYAKDLEALRILEDPDADLIERWLADRKRLTDLPPRTYRLTRSIVIPR